MTEGDKKAGRHEDNDLSRVQKVMKDNDIPFIYSKDKKEEEEDDGAGSTDQD